MSSLYRIWIGLVRVGDNRYRRRRRDSSSEWMDGKVADYIE